MGNLFYLLIMCANKTKILRRHAEVSNFFRSLSEMQPLFTFTLSTWVEDIILHARKKIENLVNLLSNTYIFNANQIFNNQAVYYEF